jgi:hypothetical protein
MAAPGPYMAGQITGPVPQLPPGQLLYYTPQPSPHAQVTWITNPLSTADIFPETKPFHTKFPIFSELPIELRLRIWQFAAHPRVIELRSWGDTQRNPYTPIKYSITPHKPPSILQINSESRQEGLRIYQRVKIGVSTTVLDSSRTYVPWAHHPHNPYTPRNRWRQDSFVFPLAFPYKPVEIYIDYSRDIIYLGPEFRSQHLQSFLTTIGQGFELSGVQHLALDRKLWIGSQQGRWEYLRNSLYSLRLRPLKALYIVPDDEVNCLSDKLYYKPHTISLLEPPITYKFCTEGQTEYAKTVVENLGEWFDRLWVDIGREPPKVLVRSVRREGRRMGDFREGAWEVQKMLGDMRVWKNWVPIQNT